MTYTMQNSLQIEFRGYTNVRMNGSERIVSLVKLTKEIPDIWTQLCINSSSTSGSSVGSNCHLNRWKFCVWVWLDVSSDGVFFFHLKNLFKQKFRIVFTIWTALDALFGVPIICFDLNESLDSAGVQNLWRILFKCSARWMCSQNIRSPSAAPCSWDGLHKYLICLKCQNVL